MTTGIRDPNVKRPAPLQTRVYRGRNGNDGDGAGRQNDGIASLSGQFRRVDDMSDQEMADIIVFLGALTDEDQGSPVFVADRTALSLEGCLLGCGRALGLSSASHGSTRRPPQAYETPCIT